MIDLTTIILTKNEQSNIRKCINSIKGFSKRIVVVDSFSQDKTVEIAESLGVEVIQNEFINHGKQWNYAINNLNIKTQWIMRLDADEEFNEKAAEQLRKISTDNTDTNINGVVFRFKVNFMGKYLRYGGVYPIRRMSFYKNGLAEMDERNLYDHIILKEGRHIELSVDLNHNDYKDLTYWVDKHNWYASGAAKDYLENHKVKEDYSKQNFHLRLNRFMKYKIYYRLPRIIRAKFNFIYRYYIRLGFLDGMEGYYYAFLQAYWYRVLVDAKITEQKKIQGDK